MDIKSVLSTNLNIDELTEDSLRESIVHYISALADDEKRRINREVAHCVIKTMKNAGNQKDLTGTEKTTSLQNTNVLAINHAGPLDVTLEWKTDPAGKLELLKYHIDSGGDQVNVSKVFSHFKKNIALVALSGKENGEITATKVLDKLFKVQEEKK